MRFAVAMLLTFALSLDAFAQEDQDVPRKDPGTATLLSVLITGGGQIYAGETGRGLALLGIGAGAAIVGAAASTTEIDCSGFVCEDKSNYTPLAIGGLVALGTWIYGIADANDAVQRYHERHGLALRPVIGQQSGLALAYRF